MPELRCIITKTDRDVVASYGYSLYLSFLIILVALLTLDANPFIQLLDAHCRHFVVLCFAAQLPRVSMYLSSLLPPFAFKLSLGFLPFRVCEPRAPVAVHRGKNQLEKVENRFRL